MQVPIPLSWWVQELDKVHCKPLWCNLKSCWHLVESASCFVGGRPILVAGWGVAGELLRGALVGRRLEEQLGGEQSGETRLASGSSSVETAQMVCGEAWDCRPGLSRSITISLHIWSVEREGCILTTDKNAINGKSSDFSSYVLLQFRIHLWIACVQ